MFDIHGIRDIPARLPSAPNLPILEVGWAPPSGAGSRVPPKVLPVERRWSIVHR